MWGFNQVAKGAKKTHGISPLKKKKNKNTFLDSTTYLLVLRTQKARTREGHDKKRIESKRRGGKRATGGIALPR